jgi:hypothetical protein
VCEGASRTRVRASAHPRSFFKDRKWLRLEFPELIACTEADVSDPAAAAVGRGPQRAGANRAVGRAQSDSRSGLCELPSVLTFRS